MARFHTAILLLCTFLLTVFGHAGHDHSHSHEAAIDESAVVVLGEDNFETVISENEFVFVEFYAPWCGHCKHLAPEYAKAAKTLKEEGSTVVVGKVDATVHGPLAQKFGVKGYPTLKFFRSKTPVDYEGQRTADDIIKYIKRKSGPASTHLTSQEAIDTFKASAGTQIIAFVTKDSHQQIWTELGKTPQVEDFGLGHVTDSALFGDHKAPSAVIYKDKEDPVHFSGEFTKTDLATWAGTEGHPLVEELAQKVWMRSQTTAKPLLACFFSAYDDAASTLAHEIGQKYKGKVLVTYSTTANLGERWGASGKKLPTGIMVTWDGQNPKFVVFDEEHEAQFDATSADNFVSKSLTGEYQGYRKSEPIPENNDGPVKVVVGKSFESVVFDKTKDVFVEFYAPWCGHCKKLSPIWDELGTAVKESAPSVVIAKIDATANSLPPEIQVQGYPTLIFFPADNKKGVKYEGERDLKNLKKFVDSHASVGNKDEL